MKNIMTLIENTPNTTPEQQTQALHFIRELVEPKFETLPDGTVKVFDNKGTLRVVLGSTK